DVVLAARFAAVRRVRAGLLPAAEGAAERRIDRAPLPIDLVGAAQLGQQQLVQALPNAGAVPVLETVEAGHAAAAAHLLGEVLPGDAGLEDEEDAGEHLAVVQGLAAGEAEAARLVGRQ